MQNEGTLPLAVSAQENENASILETVAERIGEMPTSERRRELYAQTQIFAGLRYEKNLIYRLLSEDIMKESVVYQDIIQRGLREGLQRGLQQGEQNMVLRLLDRRFGTLDETTLQEIERLSLRRLEALGEALLDFESRDDLRTWLDNAQAENSERSSN